MPCLANQSLINHSSSPTPFLVLDLSFKQYNASSSGSPLPWHREARFGQALPRHDAGARPAAKGTRPRDWERWTAPKRRAARAANEVATSQPPVCEPTSVQGSPTAARSRAVPRSCLAGVGARHAGIAPAHHHVPICQRAARHLLLCFPCSRVPPMGTARLPELRFVDGVWKSWAHIGHGTSYFDQPWHQLEHSWLPSP